MIPNNQSQTMTERKQQKPRARIRVRSHNWRLLEMFLATWLRCINTEKMMGLIKKKLSRQQ